MERGVLTWALLFFRIDYKDYSETNVNLKGGLCMTENKKLVDIELVKQVDEQYPSLRRYTDVDAVEFNRELGTIEIVITDTRYVIPVRQIRIMSIKS